MRVIEYSQIGSKVVQKSSKSLRERVLVVVQAVFVAGCLVWIGWPS